MTIKIFKNTIGIADYLIESLIQPSLNNEKTDFINIALSGGSTPTAIFTNIVEHYNNKINWQKIRLFWGDERCVPPGDDESNYKMTRKFLIDRVEIPENNIFRILGEEEPEKEALRYETLVLDKLPLKKGIPRFDLMLLGLGEDGHTASIFPGSLNLFETNNLFTSIQNPHNKQNRITATGKLINHATKIVFMVTGETKAKMVEKVIQRPDDNSKFPASHIKPVDGELYWLLDESAASLLEIIQSD